MSDNDNESSESVENEATDTVVLDKPIDPNTVNRYFDFLEELKEKNPDAKDKVEVVKAQFQSMLVNQPRAFAEAFSGKPNSLENALQMLKERKAELEKRQL